MDNIRILVRKIIEETMLFEDITLPIEIGDEILSGKFLNKKIIVKSIEKTKKGDYTINGKPLLRFRIIKQDTEDTA